MNQKLQAYTKKAIENFVNITPDRQNELTEIAEYIRNRKASGKGSKLVFICTHNSRRSHLAQIWAQLASHYYGLDKIECYSGGTEATAFNPRAVAAMSRAGFEIENPGGSNPNYSLSYSSDSAPMICFSKTYDDPSNPNKEFAAIMTCSDADEACPIVPGAEFRMPIPYIDPKVSDDTDAEEATYNERCFQIATEMFYMMSQVSH